METHLKLKSRKIMFIHKTNFHGGIILKFSSEQDSDTALLCEKFQNDLTIEQ